MIATLLVGLPRTFDLVVRWTARTGWSVAGVALLVAMSMAIGLALTPEFMKVGDDDRRPVWSVITTTIGEPIGEPSRGSISYPIGQ